MVFITSENQLLAGAELEDEIGLPHVLSLSLSLSLTFSELPAIQFWWILSALCPIFPAFQARSAGSGQFRIVSSSHYILHSLPAHPLNEIPRVPKMETSLFQFHPGRFPPLKPLLEGRPRSDRRRDDRGPPEHRRVDRPTDRRTDGRTDCHRGLSKLKRETRPTAQTAASRPRPLFVRQSFFPPPSLSRLALSALAQSTLAALADSSSRFSTLPSPSFFTSSASGRAHAANEGVPSPIPSPSARRGEASFQTSQNSAKELNGEG